MMAEFIACVLIAALWLGGLLVLAGAGWLMLRRDAWARLVGGGMVVGLILLLPEVAGMGRWLS